MQADQSDQSDGNRLEGLGYEQQLDRRLSVGGAIAQ